MSFFDTVSHIIRQGKEMAVKATPSSKQTYNKVTPVDNSQFTSNPLLRTQPLQYQKPVIQQPTFNVPLKAQIPQARTAVAETTPMRSNETMAQTVSQIIQGGKEAVKLGGGLAKDVARGTARGSVAGGTFVGARLLGADVNQANQAQFKPETRLDKFLFGDQPASIQSEGIAPLESLGISTDKANKFGAPFVLGSIALDAFTGGSSKAAKNALQKVASNMTAEDATILRNLYAKPTAKNVLPVARNEQAIINALKLDKLPYTEQKTAVDNILKEYDKRWGGVDEALNPPVKPNRAGAMDVKKPSPIQSVVTQNKTLNDTSDIGKTVTYNGSEYIYTKQRGIYGDQAVLKAEDGTEISVPKKQVTVLDRKETKTYGMSHRPTETGATADNISQEVSDMGFPKDFYKNPNYYINLSEKADSESWNALQKIKGKPKGTVTIYRASPKNELNNGDWVTLSKEYAKGESLAEGVKVHTYKVKAEDIQFAGDSVNEFGYYPKAPVNKKLEAFRSGKTSPESGHIRNPLAKAPEKSKANNQVVSSGNDNTRPKKIAINDETRSRMRQAEEMGLYETQKRNLNPEALDQRRLELSLQKEALDNDPANGLGKFVTTRGEFRGQLKEVNGKGNLFGRQGDDIADQFGFKSSEEARQAYDNFKARKQQYDINKANLAEDIKIARQENKNIKAFNQALSPLETITKRVSTNVARVTKRVEQKATKRQVDFEKRETKRQVDTTKKVYGEKIKDEKLNTKFVKRTEQKVAVRQVQFEKREARRQVIKAKAELVDKMRVANANIENIKADVVNYAKKNLPASQVGKFVSAVKNAKTQKDAIKAFNRIDNLVTEIEKKTLIRDIQKSVANLPASVEIGYANKIKELVSEINLKGYSKATLQKLEDTQKYLAEQKKLGKDVELPTRLLEKLKILGRTDAKNLTVSQLQGIQDEIELLKHLGKTKQRIKTSLYEAEKTYIADDLISTAKPLTYREIKTTPGVAQTLGIKTSNKVKQVLNRLKKARLSIRPIDGLAEATGMEQVKNRIDLSYSNYLDKLDDFAKQREVVLDRLKLNDVNMERIGIYAAKQQKGGYEKLANLGITEQAADAIKLTDAEQEYYEFGRKMFDEDFDEVKAYMQDVYNKDVGKVDNYVSFQTDFNAMNELEIYDRFGTLADDAVTRTKTVKKDFTESRQGSGGQKIKLNFDSILIRHKDNVSYMLNLGKDIKMYSEVLNDPTLRSKLGDLGTFAWKEYMSLMARKGGVDSQKQIATIDILRRNLGVGVMAYKLSTALVQVSSLADAAATIGGKWVSIGVYDVASSREARKFIIDNFPEIREMIGDDIAFLELGDDWLGKVQQAGFIPLRKLDALMRSTSAIAAYRKVANEAGVAVDFAKPNKDLIQKATKLVRQSQGSSSFKDSPLALTTGAFTGNVSVDKALFQFQSFMLNRWENIERQIWREGFGSGNYVKGFTAVFWMIVAAGIIEESSRRVSKGAINLITGEDKEQDPFIETVIGNSVNNVPIVGNIMNSLAYDSNPVPFINAAESTLGGYKRAFTGVQTTTKVKGAVDAGLGTANLLFGIPGTVQAGQLIKPLIGEPQSAGNTGNKELDKAKKEDQKATKARSEGADVIVASLVGKSPEQNAEYLKELYVSDKDMYERVIKKVEQKKLNWSVEDKAIADLGVKNGAKAEYVKSQLKKMKTPEEKSAYLTDLYTRKIISKDVLDQITNSNSDIIQ